MKRVRGTYQFFFYFGDIRKQKQKKTKKPSIIVDESGIARTTQIAQVIILAQVRFVWKYCSHQSNYTSKVCFPDCGIGIGGISNKYDRIEADIRRQPFLLCKK